MRTSFFFFFFFLGLFPLSRTLPLHFCFCCGRFQLPKFNRVGHPRSLTNLPPPYFTGRIVPHLLLRPLFPDRLHLPSGSPPAYTRQLYYSFQTLPRAPCLPFPFLTGATLFFPPAIEASFLPDHSLLPILFSLPLSHCSGDGRIGFCFFKADVPLFPSPRRKSPPQRLFEPPPSLPSPIHFLSFRFHPPLWNYAASALFSNFDKPWIATY